MTVFTKMTHRNDNILFKSRTFIYMQIVYQQAYLNNAYCVMLDTTMYVETAV